MSRLKLIFWDVQHGSACYICTPNNKHMVVDLGTGTHQSSDATFSPLLYLKNKGGISQLDGVIITHPHTDHIDDIFNFDALRPRVLFRPKHLTEQEVRQGNPESDKPKVDKYIEINTRYGSQVPANEDPFVPAVNGSDAFSVWQPRTCARNDLNNHSVVVVLSYATTKILLTGDNESCSWNELLDNPNFVSAIQGTEVLLAAHHGRESGFSEALYESLAQKPLLTIVSDGEEPDTSAVGRYTNRSRGWKVKSRDDASSEERYCLTTRDDGAIVLECWSENQQNYLTVTKK